MNEKILKSLFIHSFVEQPIYTSIQHTHNITSFGM